MASSTENAQEMNRDGPSLDSSSFITRILSRFVLEETGRSPQERKMMVNVAALDYYCSNLIKIIIPVVICMVVVSILVSHVAFFSEKSNVVLIYTPLNEDKATSWGQRFGLAIGNMLTMVSVVIVTTFIFVLLYAYGFHKILRVWLIFGTLNICFFISTFTLLKALESYNLPLDYFSLVILIWNFGAVGTIAIHWKGPLKLQQFYLVFTCVSTASILVRYIPAWTTWTVLVGMSIYDIFAVLCPYGPLRMLLNAVDQRSEPLPAALIYSSEADHPLPHNQNRRGRRRRRDRPDDESFLINAFDDDNQSQEDISLTSISTNPIESSQPISTNATGTPAPHQNQSQLQQGEEEESFGGMKLGLGDFIFYSLLVARVTLNGDTTAVAFCVLSITAGLIVTIIILALCRTALPALPFSILFGVLAYFTQSLLMNDYYDFVSRKNIFI